MTLHGDTLKDAIGRTRDKWGWFVALGVLLLIFGGIAFGNLFIATVASVYVVGWLMLMAGIIEIVHAKIFPGKTLWISPDLTGRRSECGLYDRSDHTAEGCHQRGRENGTGRRHRRHGIARCSRSQGRRKPGGNRDRAGAGLLGAI